MSDDKLVPLNGRERRPDGRFVRGNQAARRHGLQAGTRKELRRRDRRVRDLLLKLVAIATIQPRDEWAAKAFCQFEILATDAYAALREDPENTKLSERLVSYRRNQLLYARELGLTPAARAAVTKQAVGLAEQLAALEVES